MPLIIDTDASFDVDDVVAICMAHALMDNGEVISVTLMRNDNLMVSHLILKVVNIRLQSIEWVSWLEKDHILKLPFEELSIDLIGGTSIIRINMCIHIQISLYS